MTKILSSLYINKILCMHYKIYINMFVYSSLSTFVQVLDFFGKHFENSHNLGKQLVISGVLRSHGNRKDSSVHFGMGGRVSVCVCVSE